MKLLKPNLQIAIDGPVGAGKSIVAKLLSKKLGIVYVYTGAMYRAVALLAVRKQVAFDDEPKLVELIKEAKIELFSAKSDDRMCTVYLNGEDVTESLFTPDMSTGSSQVAMLPGVRQALVERQKEIVDNQAAIMEGRDIASRVLPRADVKIFMTADTEIRAKRRWRDLIKKGYNKTLHEVIKETQERDYTDSHREADPLQVVSDAWVLDTSRITIDEVIEQIIDKLREKDLIG